MNIAAKFWDLSINAFAFVLIAATSCTGAAQNANITPQVVYFHNDGLLLGGELFKPPGPGPFPVVLYNHGSAAGMLSSQASALTAPLFVQAGWAFFMPYRRGQGLSSEAGPYVLDQVAVARSQGGAKAASVELTRVLATDHLRDQLAAREWLLSQPFVRRDQIAVAGNSFGGIQAILGAANANYCAGVAASAASETWERAPELRQTLIHAASISDVPMLFFQAENDFDLTPMNVLADTRKKAGKSVETKLYPRYGSTSKDGHSFAYKGVATWFPDVLKFLNRNCLQ